jgi:hypothetical protein
MVRMSPRERLEHHVELALRAVSAAAPHTVAYVQASRALREVTAQLDQMSAAEAARVDASSMSAEQWAAMILADAQQATTEDLEVYAGELYRRIKVRPVHHADGRIELVRVVVS